MSCPKAIVAQQAIAVFKRGTLNLAWDCPFCRDHNEAVFVGLPRIVAFSLIPAFCHRCREKYVIEVRQKLTGVVTPEMKQ